MVAMAVHGRRIDAGSTNALRVHRIGDAVSEVVPAYRAATD